MKFYLFVFFSVLVSDCFSQNSDGNLPYRELPPYPKEFTQSTVAARMIEALGFRYYWATEALRQEDLKYKPSEHGRTTEETITHILDLSKIILSTTSGKQITRTSTELNYLELREQTLQNLNKAADLLRQGQDLSILNITFGQQEFPFWNLINGPIADAIWHCGQIAINRRSSGNPISPKVNHFKGNLKE